MGNTILLADKSTTIQKIVQLTFADDQYDIHTVSDGQAALEIIPRIHPDLVLADISLPVKNGYEICSAIRTDPDLASYSRIPVILLAGIYETMDEERSRQVEERVRQVEANDFLSKPFDPQLLISKVKQFLSAAGSASREATPAIFAQEPESAINLFDTESNVKPPDDAEKTMMLPGGPFGEMFTSEPAPYEEEATPVDRKKSAVDIDAVRPVDEPIFDEENFPQVELGAEQEEEENLFGQATLKLERPQEDGERFAGRQEQEFEYTSGPVLETPAPPSVEPAGSIPLILPDAEDPFGDVFQEPQAPWSSSFGSEEDSPFGAPEPPSIEMPPPVAVEDSGSRAQRDETPSSQHEEAVAIPQQEEGFDDTWPGVPVRSNMTPPVEELFESEPLPVLAAEDAEELEEDTDDATVGEQKAVAQTAAPAEASTAVTEELIDRIAERVLNKLSERVVSEIVWQVVPDLAEKMIRRELEKLHASEE